MTIETIGSFYVHNNGEERVELLWDDESGQGYYWSVHRQQRLPFAHSVVQSYDDYGNARVASRAEVLAEWEAKIRELDEEEQLRRDMLRMQEKGQ
ncbi:MAG: hypothetical protein ACOC0M_00210 [Halomonas sp.]